MICEENHALWLNKMKYFCQELDLYLHDFSCNGPSITFPKSVPINKNGKFDHLCEMSTQCTYISGIDIQLHNCIIFEIQSMARRLLIEIGAHPTMIFQTHERNIPFFEKPLFIAIALGVEHQMNANNARGMQLHLFPAKTRCS